MGKQTGKVLVGAFVVGAVVLIVVAIGIFGSGSFFKDKHLFVLYFTGSVKGLNVGSPVVLRGVKIGAVKDIQIHASKNRGFSIPVFIEMTQDCVVTKPFEDEGQSLKKHLDTLISQGLRAQLVMQSFVTGQLLVALDFDPGSTPRFSGLSSRVLEIPTVQSDIEELTQKLKQAPIEEIFNKIFSIISSVDAFLNSESINELLVAMTHALNSINALAAGLDENLPELSDELIAAMSGANRLLKTADTQIFELSGDAKAAISDFRHLLSITLGHVDRMGNGIHGTVSDARQVVAQIENEVHPVSKALNTVLSAAEKTVTAAGKSADQATAMLKSVEHLTDGDSVLLYNLNTTLSEVADAARALKNLADYLERHPEALIQGK